MRRGALTFDITCVVIVAIRQNLQRTGDATTVWQKFKECGKAATTPIASEKSKKYELETLNKQEVSNDSGQLWSAANVTAYASAYLKSHCRTAKGSQRKPIRGLLSRPTWPDHNHNLVRESGSVKEVATVGEVYVMSDNDKVRTKWKSKRFYLRAGF